MKSFKLKTKSREELIDITSLAKTALQESKVNDGTCLIYCPHTTAGITINENADPDVVRDLLCALDRAVPLEGGYHHAEGNSAAHVKSSLVGASGQVIVSDGRLVLGQWQSIFFCEFDGPRNRTVLVQILPTMGGVAL
jgi:secondary thiamine-phosphate synthase enzyme